MADKFRINVGKAFVISDYTDKVHTGGDLETINITLSYINGNGISLTAGDVLYTEGAVNDPSGFLELRSANTLTLTSSGVFIVQLTNQSMVTPGTVTTRPITIAGSLPFNLTLSYS